MAKKPSTDDDVVVIASPIHELADKPKPETKYCKNRKSEFENRIVQWLETESKTDQAEVQKLVRSTMQWQAWLYRYIEISQ